MKLEWKNWTLASILALLVGVFLRLFHINAPLVSDELASASVWAQMPFWEIPTNYQFPNNHIFHTLLLNVILKVFGVNHVMLRLPVLLGGFFSLVLAYLTAMKITKDKNIALGALILLAVNTKHIYFSTYARGYIIITLFVQLILYILLNRFQKGEGPFFSPSQKPLGPWDLAGVFVLCVLGTWTLPTFIFFEASMLFFSGSILLWNYRGRMFSFRFPYTQLCLALFLGAGVFYYQYYVLIPGKMLAGAVSRAAISPMAEFIPGVLEFFVYPLGAISYVFLFLAGIGMFRLLKKEGALFFLLACLFIIPLALPYLGALAGVMPAIPPHRAFLFLQPFYFILACMGAISLFQALYSVFDLLPLIQKVGLKNVYVPFYLLSLLIVFLSGMEFKNKTYPERISRQPYHKILEFVKNLGPQDLFVTSTSPHVWFYLYGANEMRNRVHNIMDKGELTGIYILEDCGKPVSDIKRISKGGRDYFQLKEYNALKLLRGPEPLNIPGEMFELALNEPGFKIHKIGSQYIEKAYDLRDINDNDLWAQSDPSVSLDRLDTGSGPRPAIRFQRPFTIIHQKKAYSDEELFSINLNFISVGNSPDLSVLYCNGADSDGGMNYNSTWYVNDWVMDHPYGPKIYKRQWRPRIFFSKPGGNFEFIKVFSKNPNSAGYLRDILSYRISLKGPRNEK